MAQGSSLLKGFVAGTVGGLVATFGMDLFQKIALEGTRKAEDVAGSGHPLTRQQEAQLGRYEQAHIETADRLAGAIADGGLSTSQQKVAAPAMHYAFGALCGGVYGLLAEYWRPVTFGYGTAFGVSLFAGASEAVLPALNLLPTPAETPALLHGGGLAAHAVYGAGTEGMRRLIRKSL